MFGIGEIVECIDISGTYYNGIKRPDIKGITIGKFYTILSYDNNNVYIINDKGTKRKYKSYRFEKITLLESRRLKLKQLLKNG